MMKLLNMKSPKGNPVPNQFLIRQDDDTLYFQSYNSVIVKRDSQGAVTLDKNRWDYSVTTGKYRNLFLRETKKDTLKKIETGEYQLEDLNR